MSLKWLSTNLNDLSWLQNNRSKIIWKLILNRSDSTKFSSEPNLKSTNKFSINDIRNSNLKSPTNFRPVPNNYYCHQSLTNFNHHFGHPNHDFSTVTLNIFDGHPNHQTHLTQNWRKNWRKHINKNWTVTRKFNRNSTRITINIWPESL